jgi:hypothetical protein
MLFLLLDEIAYSEGVSRAMVVFHIDNREKCERTTGGYTCPVSSDDSIIRGYRHDKIGFKTGL